MRGLKFGVKRKIEGIKLREPEMRTRLFGKPLAEEDL